MKCHYIFLQKGTNKKGWPFTRVSVFTDLLTSLFLGTLVTGQLVKSGFLNRGLHLTKGQLDLKILAKNRGVLFKGECLFHRVTYVKEDTLLLQCGH